MDAIKKHRFWILLGLAVPMILYGYIAANASLREATTKREGEIKDVESKIPPSSKPNARFAEGLKAVNEKHKAQVDAALGSLWTEQAKRMTWPTAVASRIPKTYRGDIPLSARFAYRNNEYPALWEKLFYSLEPMVPETIQGITHTQKVFVEPAALTVSVFVPNQPPSTEEVWDAQEDLWLMSMIADAIRETNKYADGPANATVRSIEAFKLLGGSGTAVPKAVMTNAMGSGGADAMAMTMPTGGSGAGGAILSGGALVNPAEEFGPDVDGAGNPADMMSSAAMPTGGPAAVKRIRYIGPTDKEYKERGFYLRVIISQMKIPEFLTTLTNCPWPVRIVRFHMSPNPHEKAFTPGVPMMTPDSYPMAGGSPESAGAFGGNPFAAASGAFSEGGAPAGYDTSGFGGGVTNVLAADAAGAANIIPGFVKVPDKFGALQHPDLIQLDVLGAITLYNPPATEPAAEAAKTETAPMEGTAPAEPMAATDPAAPAADPMAATNPAAPAATPVEGAPASPAPATADPSMTPGPAKPAEGSPAPPAAASDPAAPEGKPSPPEAKPAAPPADAPPAAPAAGENPGTSAPLPPSNK